MESKNVTCDLPAKFRFYNDDYGWVASLSYAYVKPIFYLNGSVINLNKLGYPRSYDVYLSDENGKVIFRENIISIEDAQNYENPAIIPLCLFPLCVEVKTFEIEIEPITIEIYVREDISF